MSEPPITSPKDVVVAFFADVTAGRAAEAWDRLAPDVVYDIIAPAPIGGRVDREGLGRVYAIVMGAIGTPLTLTVKGITAEGERVAIEIESVAAAKNGNTYNNHYHFLFVVRNDKIVEGREYFDSAHLLEILKQD